MYTDEDIEEFMEWYGKPLPDPEHCPRELMYLYKLFVYTKTLKQQEN
jgi:hypothetical protein